MREFMNFVLANQRFIMMALLTIFVISAFMIFSIEAKKDFKVLMWITIVVGISGVNMLLYLFPIKTSIVLMILGIITARWIRKVLDIRLLFMSIFTIGFFSGVMDLIRINKKWNWETAVLLISFIILVALSSKSTKEEEGEEMHKGEEELELTK